MNAATQLLMLSGPAGPIDTALDLPAGTPLGAAVVAHPHPLFGGTRDNKVATTIARALVSLGYQAWRPNFRGVGASAGSFDDGRGETDDLLAVARHAQAFAREHGAPDQLVLAGFSFGAYVQTHVAQRLVAEGVRPTRLVLAGVAASRWQVADVPPDTLVVHGETDDVVPLGAVLDWARPQALPVVVIPGADHFFHRQLVPLKAVILRAWGAAVPPGDTSGD